MSSEYDSNRREFLTGRAAIKALQGAVSPAADAAESISPLAAPREASAPTYLIEVSRAAMAVEFQIFLNAGQHAHATEVALQALDLVEALEDQLSVFREHSEVSQLNRLAAFQPVTVEPKLFSLLEQSLAVYEQTEGAFDITSGPLSKAWGFMRRQGRFPSEADVREALDCVGSHWLALDREQRTIRFLKPGLEINFHAIGKGHALDRCAELLAESEVQDFLIHGGHSSVLARGTRAGVTDEQRGWWVALRHPLRTDRRLGEIRLLNRALGTSGSGVQFFYHQGRRFGHVLDPRTGWPSEGVLSATVVAESAAEADALATAFYIWGVEKSAEYCRQHEGLGAVLVCPGERAGSLDVHRFGIPDAEWRLFAGGM